METLLIHSDVASQILPRLASRYKTESVELRGCERTQSILPEAVAATETGLGYRVFSAYSYRFGLSMALEQAMDHIHQSQFRSY